MIQEYVISSPNLQDVVVGFCPAGKLVKMECSAGLEPKTWLAILRTVRDKVHFDHWMKHDRKKGTKVRTLSLDISFEAFYEAYGYKEGKKSGVNAWKLLSKVNKVKAIDYISTYNNKLAVSGYNKKLPASYINAKPWED
jgi:hypothetical protein